MRKSFLVCLMFISLIIGLIPVQIEKVVATSNEKLNFNKTQSNGESWEECDSCSKEHPHLISTTLDLDKIRTHTHTENGVTTITGYFKLSNDIVFADEDFEEGGSFYNDGQTWIPIGQKNLKGEDGVGPAFCGKFDGAGFSIKNLKMTPINSDKRNRRYCGVFLHLGENGIITNTTFDGIENTNKHGPTAVVGKVTSNTAELSNITIKNCKIHPLEAANTMPEALLSFRLMGKVSDITIQDSFCGSRAWYGGIIAGVIEDAQISNLIIKNCDYRYYAYSSFLISQIYGNNSVENVSILDTEITFTHIGSGSLVSSFVKSEGKEASLSLKNMNVDVVYNREENAKYDVVSLPENANITFDDFNLRYRLDGLNPTMSRWWNAVDEIARGKGLVNLSCTDKEENEAEVISYGNAYYIVKDTPTDIIKTNEFLVGHLNGGTISKDDTAIANTLITPKKEGSIFEGWYDNEALTGDAVTSPVTGQTYYAKWKVCHHDNNMPILLKILP